MGREVFFRANCFTFFPAWARGDGYYELALLLVTDSCHRHVPEHWYLQSTDFDNMNTNPRLWVSHQLLSDQDYNAKTTSRGGSIMPLPQLCLRVRYIHAFVQARPRTPAPFRSYAWRAGLDLGRCVKLACLSSNFKLPPRGASFFFFFSKSASPSLAAEPIGTPALATSRADVSLPRDAPCYRLHMDALVERYTHRHDVFPGNWQLHVCRASAAC